MSKVRFGILVNPKSKKNRRCPDIAERLARIVGCDGSVIVTHDILKLMDALEELHKSAIDILAISGGDGTLGFVLQTVEEVWAGKDQPSLSILRGGTMNTVANAIGMPRVNQEAQLRRLIEASKDPTKLYRTSRTSLRVNGRLGFLFGTGFGRGFLEEYYRLGRSDPSFWTALLTIVRLGTSALVGGETARRSFAVQAFEINADGEEWPSRPYSAVMAGTVDEVGLGFRVFHLAEAHLEAFHLIAIHARAKRVALRLPAIRMGRPLGPALSKEALARRVVLTSPGRIVPYFVDGDLFEAESRVTVELAKRVNFVWGG